MTLMLLVAIFLLTLSLTALFAYWLLAKSTERKKIVARIQAIQETSVRGESDGNALRVLKKDLEPELPFHQRWLAALPGMPRISLFIEQGDVDMEAEAFVILSVASASAGFLTSFLLGVPSLAVLISLTAGAIPACVVQTRRRRRLRKFEEGFPDAIDQLARAVRAGHAFTAGFELIGQEVPDPVGQEFRTTFAQQKLGVPLPVALQNMATRIPLPDVRFFVAAIQIQRESGGNLGEVLDSLSHVVRERFKIMRQVQIYTAEGRTSMYVLMAMPIVAGVGVYLINPTYMTPLFTDPRGQTALIVAALLQAVGYLVIRRMIQIKV